MVPSQWKNVKTKNSDCVLAMWVTRARATHGVNIGHIDNSTSHVTNVKAQMQVSVLALSNIIFIKKNNNIDILKVEDMFGLWTRGCFIHFDGCISFV